VKFPVFFPVSREFELETGSHKTASTATYISNHMIDVQLKQGVPFYPQHCLVSP